MDRIKRWKNSFDKILKNNDFDLIVLDIMPPEYDGWSVCKRIREKSDIPILMLTARSEDLLR